MMTAMLSFWSIIWVELWINQKRLGSCCRIALKVVRLTGVSINLHIMSSVRHTVKKDMLLTVLMQHEPLKNKLKQNVKEEQK